MTADDEVMTIAAARTATSSCTLPAALCAANPAAASMSAAVPLAVSAARAAISRSMMALGS